MIVLYFLGYFYLNKLNSYAVLKAYTVLVAQMFVRKTHVPDKSLDMLRDPYRVSEGRHSITRHALLPNPHVTAYMHHSLISIYSLHCF